MRNRSRAPRYSAGKLAFPGQRAAQWPWPTGSLDWPRFCLSTDRLSPAWGAVTSAERRGKETTFRAIQIWLCSLRSLVTEQISIRGDRTTSVVFLPKMRVLHIRRNVTRTPKRGLVHKMTGL
uniref:Uncharacterized protein n=1 Tax=Myotis myotis TaxID=51298 RepID=A0A7J8ANI2_MYOMY|nr:hypothetical protein mMyoMyo1_008224 [Myotis myotis]